MADLGSLLGAAGIGGAIGQAIVRLELDTSKYSAELKAAQAETTVGANTMGSGFSKFGGLAQTALLGAGAAAVAFGAISVKAAIEANEAHIKLQNTFANNASLSDSSVEAFEAQADALRNLTGVDDEAIISGQALLGQFKLTGQQVMELTPLVVDLSAKMGIDLEAASKAVGKATEGNTGALARYIGTIEQGATPTETYANILEKLGRVQGFAAERAEAEPWRVLGAQFEEIAEKVGQALLPAIQGFTNALIGVLPVIEKVASAMQFLPIVQAGENFGSSASGVDKFANAVFDTVPILGHFVDIGRESVDALGRMGEAAENHLSVVQTLSQFYREKLTPTVTDTSKQIVKFAHLTSKEIKEWSDDVKDSFDSFTLTLDESTEATKITRKEFINATDAMQREARQLAQAMREISKEKWINDEYIKFLSEQGPEWLIGFTNLTKEEQHKAQDAWGETTRKTDAAKESLDKITGVLKNLDNGTSRHTVIVEYRYEGFDPSKPGMSGQQR